MGSFFLFVAKGVTSKCSYFHTNSLVRKKISPICKIGVENRHELS